MPRFFNLELYSQTSLFSTKQSPPTVSLSLTIGSETFLFKGAIANVVNKLSHHPQVEVELTEEGMACVKSYPYGQSFILDSPDFAIANDIESDFILVEPPCVSQHNLVAAYHQELLKQVSGIPVQLKPEDDFILYPKFRNYYQKLAKLLNPEIDTDKIAYYARHEFFIGKTIEDSGVMGLSGLAELMGYSTKEEGDSEVDELSDAITTGDRVLDITADVLLIFKNISPWLLENYGVEDLGKIANQAMARRQQAKEESENSPKTSVSRPVIKEEKVVETEKFAECKSTVVNQLEKMQIPMPKGF